MMVRALVSPAASSMARATFSGERSVRQAIVDPEPLRNPPSAPAASPAAIVRSRNGINFLRKG